MAGTSWIGVDVLEIFKSYSVPSPLGVGRCFLELMQDGSLLRATLNSLFRGILGYAIAVLIGVALGVSLYHFKYLQRNMKPIILGIQTLPSVCGGYRFQSFGLAFRHKLSFFVVVMGSAFGIAISVDNAIKNIPVIYTRVALTMGASRRQMYCYVLFPACLPEMIAGLKQGWSFAWRALMVGEVMTTSIGLGQTLIMGRDLADINQVMLVMIVIVVVGIVIDKCIFSVIERHVLGKRGLQK